MAPELRVVRDDDSPARAPAPPPPAYRMRLTHDLELVDLAERLLVVALNRHPDTINFALALAITELRDAVRAVEVVGSTCRTAS
jgi:hypothetical protein